MTTARGLDRATLEQLHRRLEKPLFNIVYRYVWSAEEARDVVQDAFVRLWQHRDEVDTSRVEPLLYRIALNLATNRARARKVWRWVGLESVMDRRSEAKGAAERLAEHQRHAEVRRAVEALPPKLREVVLMFEFSGLGYQEIAEALGIPPGTVASRRSAALKQLGKALARELLDEVATEVTHG